MSGSTGGNQHETSPAGPGKNPLRSGRLGLELAIIFVGVFGAFIAEDVRQQREDDRRAEQIYQALLGEIRVFSQRAPVVADSMRARVDSWSLARAEGETPAPPFYREPDAETPPTAIWAATLASGGVALLEPRLFNELANFYNRLTSVSDRYMRYNAFTESQVLPNLDRPEVFYRDGLLKGEFRAHMERLAEIEADLRARTEEAYAIEGLLAEALND